MLTPITNPGVPRRFAVYDLEWYPETYEVRLVGVFDGRSYRSYPSVDAFLEAELSHENEGVVFFAHAGGLADVQFILERMLHNPFSGWVINAAFSGSSAIIVRAERGRGSWTFADSYWLLRDSLAKIGASIGMEKGGADYYCPNHPSCGHDGKCIFWAPIGILRDYNELDCRILWNAINRFQFELLDLGGELALTVASCAMRLFRGAYLKQAIPTDPEINETCRSAYIASRVEPFESFYRGSWEEGPGGVITKLHDFRRYYDVNSSFPFSMTKPQPGKAIRSSTRWAEGKLSLVNATVTVPAMDVPPIPMRASARVYFPTGTWDGWFMGTDLQLLLESGGRIESISRCHDFEPFDDFRGYVETLYSMRRSSKDSFRKLLLKYLLNSLYGKTGEQSEKDTLIAGRKPKKNELRDVRELAPGVWVGIRDAKVEHAWVPIAANITAESRALLTRGIWRSGRAMYCDTDSITTDCKTLGNSTALGELKQEYEVLEARFAAAKLYRLKVLAKKGADGKLEPALLDEDEGPFYAMDKIRAKGFAPRRGLTSGEFDELVEGTPMRQVRMLRVREVLASGDLRPREQVIEKRVLLAERPKRCPLPDGRSRPWDVSELEAEGA